MDKWHLLLLPIIASFCGCGSSDSRTNESFLKINLSGYVVNDSEANYSGDFRIIKVPIDEFNGVFCDVLIKENILEGLTNPQRTGYIEGFNDYWSNRLGIPNYVGSESDRKEFFNGYENGSNAAKNAFRAIFIYFSDWNSNEKK